MARTSTCDVVSTIPSHLLEAIHLKTLLPENYCLIAFHLNTINACTHLHSLPYGQIEHVEINYDTHTNVVRPCIGGLRVVCLYDTFFENFF